MIPKKFGAPTPNTSRPMRDGEEAGRNYHFLTREEMEVDIKNGKYLEFGELKNNYYGTSLSALKVVIDAGKTCIVDPKSAVSYLSNSKRQHHIDEEPCMHLYHQY